MEFLKRIAGLFTGSGGSASSTSGRFYTVAVKCARCGEVVEGRINLYNDLSFEDDENGGAASTLAVRKVLVGSGRCFQPLEVVLRFDGTRKLIEKTVTGGSFVE
jgi:hypothetical protein